WHLMKSISLIRQKKHDVKLMLIGAGDFDEYKELAKKLHMEQDVLFTGVQKNPFALLARADVYALTSDSEGFPNALIEAMACGLPCVSVNCKTGPAEILQDDYQKSENQNEVYHGDYGVLTPILKGAKNLNPDEITEEEKVFAEELEMLLIDDNMWAGYQNKVVKRAADFGMEAYVKEIERLIAEDT
ncbi:MAG: glycosyltransferase, partial [Lachnospiraceae bacterium]|nr:glycosyltransferase [Lachnospiraceae bacterium]